MGGADVGSEAGEVASPAGREASGRTVGAACKGVPAVATMVSNVPQQEGLRLFGVPRSVGRVRASKGTGVRAAQEVTQLRTEPQVREGRPQWTSDSCQSTVKLVRI